MTTIPTDLPGYLEWVRQGRGLSKRAFAEQLGISHAIYVKLTTSGKHIPLNQTLITIAHALKLPLARVLELAGVDLGIPVAVMALSDDPALHRVVQRLLTVAPGERLGLVAGWLGD